MTLYDSMYFRGLHSIDLIVSKLGHRIEDYLDSTKIYRTRDTHANHHTAEVVSLKLVLA
jgi:hypothetical protein